MFLKMVAFGLFLTVFGVLFIKDGFAVKNWDELSGEVVDVRIKIDSSLQDNSIGQAKNRLYFPFITYRWTVDATFIPLLVGLLLTTTGGLIYQFKDQLAAQANQG